ncbi:MAG: imidazolonepropionase [Bacteroidales bacterium]|nr:imidazolonepropionase [Bacteroidales bacterium]
MKIIKNIGQLAGILPADCHGLYGAGMSHVEIMPDAWLTIGDDGMIMGFGPMTHVPEGIFDETIDARGAIVTPTFCDSHTHLVYAGSREGEFIDKIRGLGYAEIAAHGGGILNSADRLNDTDEDTLFEQASRRLTQVRAMGTGVIEIKSGYGLTLDGELKMLRVIRRLREAYPDMAVKSTFLGAHAVGRAYAGRQEEYVSHVIDDMLPAVAGEGLADYVDVFCEEGFFTVAQTERILSAGTALGITPRLHANQLHCSGGVQTGIACGAVSVDHLESVGDAEIEALRSAETIPTLLPGASFFLGEPFAPARRLIEAGCRVALASDYNPGSSPSGSMKFVWSLGCIKMKLSPEEAFNAITINAAAALGLTESYGSITPGKAASLIIYQPWVNSLAYIPYAYTEPTIARVLLRGCDI